MATEVSKQSLIKWMLTEVCKQSLIKWMVTEICKQSSIKWMVTEVCKNQETAWQWKKQIFPEIQKFVRISSLIYKYSDTFLNS